MDNKSLVLQDDGKFYLELNVNQTPAEADGFLHHRCPVSMTTPGGYECVGSFTKQPTGKWRAGVSQPCAPDSDEDMRVLGEFERRLDAVVAVWSARGLAYCTH